MKGILRSIRAMQRAVTETCGQNDLQVLRDHMLQWADVVIVGSGNSCYAARYLQWLLSHCSGVRAWYMSPLDYIVCQPSYRHVCLLLSQGAARGDSLAIEQAAERRGAPLFVVCDRDALLKETVAARLAAKNGREFVIGTWTGNENHFINLKGAAAAFAAAYEIAAAVMPGLPAEFPQLDWEAVDREETRRSATALDRRFVLAGPAGRAAAEAFAGYHCESLGPMLVYDLKNFTHGVWRGLREAGRHAIYLVADRPTEPLTNFLLEHLQQDHECIIVRTQDDWHERHAIGAGEPFELFVRMTYCWSALCAQYAKQHPNWKPLGIDMREWEAYRGINAGFDLTQLDLPHWRS